MKDFRFHNAPEDPIPEKVMEKLRPYITEVGYSRGHILFSGERSDRNIYIIREGFARAYIHADGRDITIWFGGRNDVILSAQDYVYGKKGYETMELVEDSVLYKIDMERLAELYRTDIEVCNWGRAMIEREFVNTEQRLIYSLSLTATERYLHLIEQKPEILRKVQLQHIASYLGISPESLSRIRTAAAKK